MPVLLLLGGGVVLLGAGVAAGDVPGGCVPGTTPGAALGLEVRLFSTFCTPCTPLATSTARATWAGVSTVPVSLTTPPLGIHVDLRSFNHVVGNQRRLHFGSQRSIVDNVGSGIGRLLGFGTDFLALRCDCMLRVRVRRAAATTTARSV